MSIENIKILSKTTKKNKKKAKKELIYNYVQSIIVNTNQNKINYDNGKDHNIINNSNSNITNNHYFSNKNYDKEKISKNDTYIHDNLDDVYYVYDGNIGKYVKNENWPSLRNWYEDAIKK